jgi:CspA family cold shock protein
MTGKVKWYNELKRFGFIAVAGQKDVFLHRKNVPDPGYTPNPGDSVDFETEEGEKGLVAKEVKKLEG